MPQAVCISHSSDVDGLVSAALVKAARQAKVILVGYGGFIQALKGISNTSEVFVCDLGLSPGTIGAFAEEARRITGFAELTYIDHHPKVRGAFDYRSSSNLVVVHSVRDCTSALVYHHLKDGLPSGASIFVACASLADYLGDGPIASKIISEYDRLYLYFETSILAYALEEAGGREEHLESIVDAIAVMRHPHEIKGLINMASRYARRVAAFYDKAMTEGKAGDRYAYIYAGGFPKGTAANLVRCALRKPVGLAYSTEEGSEVVEVSLRAAPEYSKDLGLITRRLASRLGGFGGGHPKASGARIPKNGLQLFLSELERLL